MKNLVDISRYRKMTRVERDMSRVEDYQQWMTLAQRHDDLSGGSRWRKKEDSTLYDSVEIRKRHDELAELLKTKNHSDLLFALNEGLHGNLEGMGQPVGGG